MPELTAVRSFFLTQADLSLSRIHLQLTDAASGMEIGAGGKGRFEGIGRIKHILPKSGIYCTAAAGTLPHQFQPISPPTHPRRTGFQPIEAQFSGSTQ